jgi:CRP-like cAMP-binding protein
VLPPAALPSIARAATRVTLAKGEALFEAGTPGDAVYLVRSGLLQIMSAATLGGQSLGEVARGEHVGEMAVLTGEPAPRARSPSSSRCCTRFRARSCASSSRRIRSCGRASASG